LQKARLERVVSLLDCINDLLRFISKCDFEWFQEFLKSSSLQNLLVALEGYPKEVFHSGDEFLRNSVVVLNNFIGFFVFHQMTTAASSKYDFL